MLCVGTSAASFLAALGGLGVAALVVGGKRWPLVLLLSALILGAAFSPDTATDLLFPGKTDDQLSTLHGRTHLWAYFVEFVEESPWIGHGFAMGAKLGGVNATNTHNSLFSVLLGTGVVGVFLVVVAALCLAREISKNNKYRRSGSAGAACALAAGLANSMSIGFLGEAWREITLVFIVFLTLHVLTFTRAGARCTPAV
jgi:O-antigen ligase